MDWAGAIAINHKALARIVAGLIAILGLANGGAVARLPKPLYRALLVMMRPTEAAMRRLIVIAARGLKVKLRLRRPMPKGLVIAGKGEGRVAFQLFDTRKRFAAPRPSNAAAGPKPTDGCVDAQRLSRRLAALKLALDTLPAQAKRLARWKARRKQMASPKFTSPLRPGQPPGHRKRPTDEIDFVLKECHGLAWDALREDTS
jgi:hypothetical protein